MNHKKPRPDRAAACSWRLPGPGGALPGFIRNSACPERNLFLTEKGAIFPGHEKPLDARDARGKNLGRGRLRAIIALRGRDPSEFPVALGEMSEPAPGTFSTTVYGILIPALKWPGFARLWPAPAEKY